MTRPDLVERVRAELGGRGVVREQRMFGGTSFLLDDRIVVAARRDGNLLVRIDPGDAALLRALPGAGPAIMGQREMGDGWLVVAAAALDDGTLAEWIDRALAHHAAG